MQTNWSDFFDSFTSSTSCLVVTKISPPRMATRDNLPDVLREFFEAIEEMSSTVMVPHRLVDIPVKDKLASGIVSARPPKIVLSLSSQVKS